MDRKQQRNIDGIINRNARTSLRPTPTPKQRNESIIVSRAERPRRNIAEERPQKKATNNLIDRDKDIDAFLTELGYEEGLAEAEQAREDQRMTKKELKRQAKRERAVADKAKGKMSKKKKITLWVVGILLLLLVVGGVLIYKFADDFVKDLTDGGSLWDVITADPTIPLKQDANGRTNIIIAGSEGYSMTESSHEGWQLTDSMIVASINQEVGDIKMISLPRDMISEERCTATGKLNEVYWCNYTSSGEDEKTAMNQLAVSANKITGLDIHYFVHANWAPVVQIVDAIGGVDIAFEYIDNKDSYTGDDPVIWTTDPRGIRDLDGVDYANGTVQHLDGVHALAIARARSAFCEMAWYYGECESYGSDGNWSREHHQQVVIEAIVKKVKQTNFVTDFMAGIQIKNAIGDNLQMSFQDKEFKTLFALASKVDVGNMMSIDIKGLLTTGMLPVPGVNDLECGGSSPGCLSYVYPKAGKYTYTAIREYISEQIVSNPIKNEGAVVDVVNGGGAVGSALAKSEELMDLGYITGQVGDVEGQYIGIVVYCQNETKHATKQALAELYGVEVRSGLPDGWVSDADFVVIVGAEG